MAVSTVSGLTSGIDWQSTVDSLMKIEGQRRTMLQSRKAEYSARLSAWQEINSKILQMQTLAENMDDADEFLTKNISSSDSDIVTATANTSASTGNFAIEINQLAKAEKTIHAGWIDQTVTAVNSSGSSQEFVYTYGTSEPETITITVPDGATLGNLRDLINNDADNPGVTATIINDGSESATAYHLVLTADDTGEDNSITIEAETTLGDGTEFDDAAWQETQTAQNAQIRVDNYPPGSWIESADNDVKEVISGVTLHLTDVTDTQPVVLTINNDISTVKSKITDFVESYNAIVEKFNQYDTYDSETQSRGLLFGDGGVSNIKRRFQNVFSNPVEGLNSSNSLRSLSEIGIRNSENGALSVDDTKLSDALTDHFDEVGDLFAFSHASESNALTFFYRSAYTQGGEHEIEAAYDASGALVSATINGHEADIQGTEIIGRDDYPEEGLRIRFSDPGDGPGTVSSTVTLSMGISAALSNVAEIVTEDTDGLIQMQKDQINDTIETLADQIEDQTRRLEITRQKYIKQFTTMELQVSKMKQQGDYLSSQLSKL